MVANQRMVQSMIPSKIPTGPWRAPGSNVIAFCVQSFLHECAVAANRDYVDFLVELMGEPRATSSRSVRRRAPHRSRRQRDQARGREGRAGASTMPAGRGLGLAFHFSHRGHFAEVADVSVDASKKVTVHKIWVVADIGPIVNLSSAENQCQGSVIDALEHGDGSQDHVRERPRRADATSTSTRSCGSTRRPRSTCTSSQRTTRRRVAASRRSRRPHPRSRTRSSRRRGQRVRTLPFSVEGYSVYGAAVFGACPGTPRLTSATLEAARPRDCRCLCSARAADAGTAGGCGPGRPRRSRRRCRVRGRSRPRSTIADSRSKLSSVEPPPQWPMPGTRNRRLQSSVASSPPLAAATFS